MNTHIAIGASRAMERKSPAQNRQVQKPGGVDRV